MTSFPAGESGSHRDRSLRAALVGIRDDPLLTRRERRPPAVPVLVCQAGHWMVRDRTGEFAVPLPCQPLGSAIAVGEPGRLLVAGKRLVDVVQQARRLDEPPIDRDPPG